RLRLEVREVDVAEVELDVEAHRHQDEALEVGEDPLDQGGRDDEQGVAEDGAAGERGLESVHAAPDEDRREEPEDRRGEDRRQAEGELPAIAPAVGVEVAETGEPAGRASGPQDISPIGKRAGRWARLAHPL